MTIENLLKKISTETEKMDFQEVISTIDANYNFTPTAFQNGTTQNEAGQNSGSCKLFSFAKLHNLSKEATLSCFGTYYREDVLKNPEGSDHQNIRNFMQFGWDGIVFEGLALIEK
jgi:hypothetical protein